MFELVSGWRLPLFLPHQIDEKTETSTTGHKLSNCDLFCELVEEFANVKQQKDDGQTFQPDRPVLKWLISYNLAIELDLMAMEQIIVRISVFQLHHFCDFRQLVYFKASTAAFLLQQGASRPNATIEQFAGRDC